jgi:hypothetical protein
MVEVVGRDEKAKRRVTHSRCGMILEYYDREVRSQRYTDYGGGSETYYFIVCPECFSGDADAPACAISSNAKVEVESC